jgi:hypothetical protein
MPSIVTVTTDAMEINADSIIESTLVGSMVEVSRIVTFTAHNGDWASSRMRE